MKPAHLIRPARQLRPRTLRRQALRRLLRALRRGRALRPLVSALVGALPLVALHPAAVAGSFPRGVAKAWLTWRSSICAPLASAPAAWLADTGECVATTI